MVIVRTAWTDKNPGRCFWGCPTEGSKCRFIGLFDGPMCARSKAIIPGLLRTINKLKSQNTRLKGYPVMQLDVSTLVKFYNMKLYMRITSRH
uniref:Zinc finger GRF-type domain-containing protein n=1 Tax=Lactuca sativa TaxID=4236 RepID=A0A9R1WT89_LACSA|nr:hypothetical protein LSAT_V11C900458810 [Lactuca sativa]